MKKFSVIFVAMLIALMLFVGCENKPKEREATEDDMYIIGYLVSEANYLSTEKPLRKGVELSEDGTTFTFNNVKITDGFVLCGTLSQTANSDGSVITTQVNFTNGTRFEGLAHTLILKYVHNTKDPSKDTYEMVFDGYRLTGFEKESNSGQPGQGGSSANEWAVYSFLSDAVSELIKKDSYPNVEIITTINKFTAIFNHAEFHNGGGSIILNGTYELTPLDGKYKIDLTSGTSINGIGHTLCVEGTTSSTDIEIILDGNKYTLDDLLMEN